ncbi:MAG: methylamine methyltransferase corrinoid protein reductive activase [Candidatus Methylarchaceae archaeon HK02M1]|nr:methylamine methyltransferase corrinoid protein reductive activase [Candidatus Methylarchaceae archaeon HK01M]MCP8311864.1 methylamine methyltransferase corrinoid protein reductive activase [Candidatus Methylarchaceae archaeon HK02M1]
MSIVIGVDIGTSGIRAQAIELESKKVLSTAITLRHPLPGSNVMDHLDFCISNGVEVGHKIVARAVENVLLSLDVNLKKVERIAFCGNPIQLSIFQGIEIRDLAYAGDAALEAIGLSRLERRATVMNADKVGLSMLNPKVDVCIPPAVVHMIGADAIAMIFKSGLLDRKEIALVTDYGTNAEIGLMFGDEIYTGSAAAGPAIEGQEIEKGMLASPGAISDVNLSDDGLQITVLDDEMIGHQSYSVDAINGSIVKKMDPYLHPRGITGTGTIAAVYIGMQNGLIRLPHISTPDKIIRFYGNNIYFTEKDLTESGKAFGAFRAGHLTLVNHLGLSLDDIKTAYMAGAGGTYVDAYKAQGVGLVPSTVKNIYQVGNTSLAFACDIAKDIEVLDKAQEIADQLRRTHVMFPLEQDFKNAYIVELGFWSGMPMDQYHHFLKHYKLPDYPERKFMPKINRIVIRDIPILGEKGLHVVREIGTILTQEFEGCTGCESCKEECPEEALEVVDEDGKFRIVIRTDLCIGISCKRCEKICPEKVFEFSKLKVEEK